MIVEFRIPEIETERLRLRAPKASDFEAYAAFRESERSRGVGGPYTRDQAYVQFCELFGHWILRGYGRWVVSDRRDDSPLGVVGLYYPEDWPEPEIAWAVFEGGEGKGYATEAALATRAHAYGTLGWTSVISCVMPGNARSEALAERLGAKREGVYHHADIGPLDIWRHPSAEAVR
jgi:ribosomal-protein-alanine N-acetyltransferase